MKPPFEEIIYYPICCWGAGNNIIGPQLIARVQLREPNKKEERKLKKINDEAKKLYDQYINVGQRFRAAGSRSTPVQARITFINREKQTVSWKQDNLTDEQKSQGLKPASGRWSIAAMIQIIKQKELEFL